MDYTKLELLLRLSEMSKAMQISYRLLMEDPDDVSAETSLRKCANTLQNFLTSDIFSALEKILSETGKKKEGDYRSFRRSFLLRSMA